MTVEYKTNDANLQLDTARPRSPWLVWGAIAVWLAAAGVIGFWLGSRNTASPSDRSPEAGFARDMSIHHANAVEMALLLRDQTDDEEMRLLALDIALTQQTQIGQMHGWLDVWGLPIASLEPAMSWMGMPAQGLMPGMASLQEMNQLSDLRGVEADITFLNLMIRHHQSGVDMARAILDRTDRPEVVALAQSIVISQESEIANMRDILQRKGSAPPEANSEMPGMQHGGDGS